MLKNMEGYLPPERMETTAVGEKDALAQNTWRSMEGQSGLWQTDLWGMTLLDSGVFASRHRY